MTVIIQCLTFLPVETLDQNEKKKKNWLPQILATQIVLTFLVLKKNQKATFLIVGPHLI